MHITYCQIFGYRTQDLRIPTDVWLVFGLVCSAISTPCRKGRAMPLHLFSAIWFYCTQSADYLSGPFFEQYDTVSHPRFLAVV